jgi:hypothetical protein
MLQLHSFFITMFYNLNVILLSLFASLMPAFEVVMLMADHSFCVRHLHANFKDIGGHQGVALKEKLWASASAYTEGVGNDWNPCVHACAAIRQSCKNAEDYVDEYYTLEMYKKVYDPVIYPMPNEEQWITTHHDMLEPQ